MEPVKRVVMIRLVLTEDQLELLNDHLNTYEDIDHEWYGLMYE
jgi:hypothetical protein